MVITLTTTNPGGHSSQPVPENAIYDMAAALEKIAAHEFPTEFTDTTRAFFSKAGKLRSDALGAAMLRLVDNPGDAEALALVNADKELHSMLRTTCVATMIDGGHARNALPQRVEANVNCRIFPGMSVDEVKGKLAAAVANPALEIVVRGEPTVSPISDMREDVTAALSKAVHARYPGLPIGAYMESGGTDGMHFRKAGVPTLAMSPIFMKSGDMFAHGLNERLPVASFYNGLDHFMIIIKELAGPASAN